MTLLWIYAIYLLVSVGITIWVARTLQKNGTVYVTEGTNTNSELADAVSHLLTVGFYLVNIGLISLALKTRGPVFDYESGIELLSTKIGWVLLALGCMHFVILLIFTGLRKNNRKVNEPFFEGEALERG